MLVPEAPPPLPPAEVDVENTDGIQHINDQQRARIVLIYRIPIRENNAPKCLLSRSQAIDETFTSSQFIRIRNVVQCLLTTELQMRLQKSERSRCS